MKALRDQRTNLEAAECRGRWVGKIQTLQELLGEPVSESDELAICDLGQLKEVAETLQTRLRSRLD